MTRTGGSGCAFVFTCEHGGNRIPARYRSYFVGQQAQLDSHRGFDAGALTLAQDFARRFDAPLIAARTSRLLIDLNRSHGHRALYSEALLHAPARLREEVFERYYRPYRDLVTHQIEQSLKRVRCVVHISVHSFTPELNGVVRDADVGLLYDPGRGLEKALLSVWQPALRQALATMTIRRNYPYAGKSDGFTTALRARFDAAAYAGIEIEINQKHVQGDAAGWASLRKKLVTASALALK